MGYDLKNTNEDFRFSRSAWSHVLNLAKHFGWEPMGTVMPGGTAKVYLGDKGSDKETVRESIMGDYYANTFESVVKEDALNLGHALMKVVEVIPDERVFPDNILTSLTEDSLLDVAEVLTGYKNRSLNYSVGYFSGLENKNYLKEFIQFCKDGRFSIH